MTYRTESSVDPRISPALFLRADALGEATQSAAAEPAESSATQRERMPRPEGNARPALDVAGPTPEASILDAFLGYAESRLVEAERLPASPRYDGPAASAYRHLRARGFSHDEIRELRFGLYTSPQDVHDWLRRMGFAEGAIRESGLVFDTDGRPRHDWTGNVVVPLANDRGLVNDLFAFDPADPADARYLFGPEANEIAAYGLAEARFATRGGERLVLVEDVVDGMLLRRRGLPQVAATGCPPARFTGNRWRHLVREGITSVTLAFARDAGRASRIHDVLANVLAARVAPEVFVVDAARYRDAISLAALVRTHGAEPARSAIAAAVHAFDPKDYGPRSVTEPSARPATPATAASFDDPRNLVNGSATSGQYHAFLAAEVEKIAHPAERSAWRLFVADVDAALDRGELERAKRIVDGWYARLRCEGPSAAAAPTTVRRTFSIREAIESIRRETPRQRGELAPLAGDDFVGEAVETIEVSDRPGRLATLAERLGRAIEDRPEGCHVVVTGEFDPRETTLALIARMVRGLTDGPGFTVADVWARLTGNDPRGGYADRPWLVDEAVDRLQRMAARIRLVPGGERLETTIDTIEAQRGERDVESILGDGTAIDRATARALAAEFDCPVTIVREPIG